MANNFQDVQQGAIELIDRIKQEVKGLDAQVLKLNENVKKLTTSGGITPQKTVDQIKALEAEMTKLNSVIKKQTTQIEKLKEARKKENVEIKSAVPNLQKLKKFKDDENASNNRAIKTYSQLIAKHRQVKKALQDAIVAHGKNSREVKRATREYNKYNKKVLQAQKATSNFAKKGLGSAFMGFKNLLGAFGIAGATVMFARFAESGFKLAKKLDSLNFAMETVISNSNELERTQAFLADITEKYGAEIVTTTERYIKFLTAAKQSNVALSDTEKIFESVTKAAGVLGLSTDELNGTYLALEQMLSKGKVTTEELRRQLGERLPGAFGIMADALGVTTEELDKMLRAGEILSADALPKFAKALEKAYGIENINNVKTLQAETSRLSNAWTTFVGGVTKSEGLISKALMSVLRGITSVVNALNVLNTTQSEFENSLSSEAFTNQNKWYESLGDSANKYAEIDKKNAQIRISNLKKQISAQEKVLKPYEKWSSLRKSINGLYQKERNDLEDLNESLSTQQGRLTAANAQLGLLKINQKELNKENKEGNDTIKEEIELLEGTVSWYKQQIQLAKEVRDNTALNTDEYQKQTEGIEKLEEALIMLIGARKDELKSQKDNIGFGEGTNKADELLNDLVLGFDSYRRSIKESKEETKEFKDELNDFFKTFQTDFFSNAGFDFLGGILTDIEGFKDLLDESENDWAIWANSIMEVGQEAFGFLQQNQDTYFETQLYNLERERDIAIQFAGDSATAREEIERQYEEKRRAIQQKQAKAEKDQALFNIAINTAQAVVSVLAQEPGGVIKKGVAAAIVGGIGLAQLAVVASRPVPEFFRGTMNAPEGMALVDEKQPEVHTDRSGNIKSFGESGANYRWLSSGDKIYKSHDEYFEKELSNVLSVNDVLPYREALSTSSPVINVSSGLKKEVFVREINRLGQKIMEKETSVTRIDKNGFYTGVRRKGAEIERQNNILKLKGGIV